PPYRRQLDTSSLAQTRAGLESRLAVLRTTAGPDSPLVASLRAKDEQLRTMEALETPHHVVDRVATEASQVAPRPVRNGLLGLLLGIVLGIALAFLRDELDTRVRTSVEVGRVLELPLLALL